MSLTNRLAGYRARERAAAEKIGLCPTGANGDEVTPVPIPNTEVKLISVENTWLATAWEDRAVPVLDHLAMVDFAP